MTTYFLLSSEESSIFQIDGPSYDVIRAAFAGVPLAGARWIGPGPRVTRHTASSGLQTLKTDAAWLLAFDSGSYTLAPPGGTVVNNATPAQAAQIIAQYLQNALAQNSSDWTPVQVTPYDSTTHGSVDFWNCTNGTQANNCASNTQSKDTYPAAGATAENPVGPPPRTTTTTTPLLNTALHPTTTTSPNTTQMLLIGGMVLVGAVGLYFAWSALSSRQQATQAPPQPQPRPNPSRYGRRPAARRASRQKS